MFSEQNVPKGGDFATVACFYVAGAPKKKRVFCLEGFFCALTVTRHRLLGPWWPVCFSAFPLPLPLDIGCLW